MVRLKDIAEHVGVSVTTVSRVIKDDPTRNVNADIKKRVWLAVKELGYTPNEHARQLVHASEVKVKRTRRIAWLASPGLADDNPYFSRIFKGISETFAKEGYTLVLLNHADLKDEAVFHRIIREKEVEGVLLVDAVEEEILQEIKKLVPVVGVDFNYSDHSISTVDYDREEAVHKGMEHLVEKGHRRIGFIGGEIDGELKSEKRFRGYKKSLSEFGLELKNDYIIDSRWCMEQAYIKTKNLLDRQAHDRPSALLCASDLLAIAGMRAAHELDLKIPEDIAFLGIDNNEMARYVVPALTTISIPQYEMGIVAAKTLLNKIKDELQLDLKTLLPSTLLIRQST
ncbi:LacI family DNA-binding transcriptional regulator [Sporosarcina gallistercoris]|uniref:LacI family DNA-binding transcriptional regulator n=1 Tax=Sporosarcina gallistercoris TaxID=2762245 RepID=A0ABR8PJA2_9BACL|nr:LacI family DNA-binding transcriptional regulator [Sporosarcina gallistercoris]MBD7908236.1 LacI family DNA-binding transcriptional regulator [Sporosarcina gallistercoris]